MALGLGLGLALGGLAGGIGSWLAGDKASREQRRANDQNAAMQEMFAKMGIRWRVEDALAAGIHPLAALGASGASFSPSYQLGDTGEKYRALGNMGQDLFRAASSGMTQQERIYNKELMDYNLKKLRYENKLLDGQINGNSQPLPPAINGFGQLIPGQNSNRTMDIIPTGRTVSSPGDTSKAYGSITDWYFRNLPGGRLKVAPSPDVQGVLANNAVEMLKWEAKHHISQMTNPIRYRPSYSEFPLPKNMRWQWDPYAGEWYPEEGSRYEPVRTLFNRRIKFRK